MDHLQELEERERMGLPRLDRTLGEAAEAYLEHRSRIVAHNTWGSDRTALRHAREYFGDGAAVAAALSGHSVQELVDARLREGYAGTTLRTYVGSLHGFASWLGLPSLFDGAHAVDLPERPRNEVDTWDAGELETIREAASWVDDTTRGQGGHRLAVELALATGARQSELFALRWGDFDRESASVRIVRQVSRARGEPFSPTKSNRTRQAFVQPDWWEFHDGYLSGLVLPGRSPDHPRGHRSQRRLLERVLHAARLKRPGVAWHSFRHTYARRYVVDGGRLEELQRFLGHASITTTQQEYGHFGDDEAVRAAHKRLYAGTDAGKLRAI